MKTVLHLLKWLLILLILLFAIATFMGSSYMQTAILLLAVILLIWWPVSVKKSLGKRSNITRIAVIIMLLICGVTLFPPKSKTSIYKTPDIRERIFDIYNEKVSAWPAGTEDIYISTDYGKIHVLACGETENQPLLMFHAASMGAHSWRENLPPLLGHFRIYAIDNPGEGNKSELSDAVVFPKDGKAIADFYAEIAQKLGIERSPVFGASNGGFIALNYAFYYPEKVESLALFGPMGLTKLTGKSIMMLSIASMYPFQFVRDEVTHWGLGTDVTILKNYGDWFETILFTMPSVAHPVPMTSEQKQRMKIPVLLFLGTRDPIVGDAEKAAKLAREFPDIQIEILDSGHLIAVEKATEVNKVIGEFLNSKSNRKI